MELNNSLFDGLVEADPRRLTREMGGLLSIEVLQDGDGPPILLYKANGRVYVAEVRVWDATGVQFYERKGLMKRLNELREALPDWKSFLVSGNTPRSHRKFEKVRAMTPPATEPGTRRLPRGGGSSRSEA
jgi:hypothetical protein